MHMLEQHMGQDHVSAQDQADENMARLGSGVYLTKYKDEYPTVEMTSANQLTINPGSLLVNGRYCIIETPEVLTVDNGSSGMTERDLVCVHWKEVEAEVPAASGDDTQTITKEEVDLVIVKGTPASSGATDPTIAQQTIRSGVGEAWVPFARITKDGLTPSVALIVDKLAPESEFRDSISRQNIWVYSISPRGTNGTQSLSGSTWLETSLGTLIVGEPNIDMIEASSNTATLKKPGKWRCRATVHGRPSGQGRIGASWYHNGQETSSVFVYAPTDNISVSCELVIDVTDEYDVKPMVFASSGRFTEQTNGSLTNFSFEYIG